MNEEDVIKLFGRQSGGKLFRVIKEEMKKDPSDRDNSNKDQTLKIFLNAGISTQEHNHWRDVKMLPLMDSISLRQWGRLNTKNLEIEDRYEEGIDDGRDKLNWQDTSLSWNEAEVIAAEEWVNSRTKRSSTSASDQNTQKVVNIKSLTYEQMREEIQEASNGITNEAIRQATYRAIKKALKDKCQPPIAINGCVKGYAIQEINEAQGLGKHSLVRSCKYICTN